MAAKSNKKTYFFKLLTDTEDTTIIEQPSPLPDTTKPFIKDSTLKDSTKIDSSGTVIGAPDSVFQNSLHNDSIKIQRVDSMHISKDTLDSPIEYGAEDSGVLYLESRQFYLYGKATAKNKDVELTANNIQYNQQTQLITAFGGTDTANNPLSKPTIVQAGQTSISDTIKFDIKSQRALTKNTYYSEGELYVHAKIVKKISKDEVFAYQGRFTTCNLDTPHFDIRAKKMKIIANKIAVSGPAFPEFEGVPIPIAIPFGIYPLARGRHSGLLPVQFATNERSGLGLEGLGYYKVMNDNWDVTARGNIYTYGGWTLSINPKYFRRYKYSGNLNVEIQHSKTLNSTSGGFSKEEFTKNQSFFVTWSHSQDTKARPGTTFSASVNAGSTKFNELIPNNPIRNINNQLQSSIAYSKTWDQGKYNLTVSANHNQNSNLRLQNVSLPTIGFTVANITPFQPKELIGTPKWYQKLGISYTGRFVNQFSFYDTAFNIHRILDTARFGAEHNIPISLSLPALGPLIISPGISYSERWFGEKYTYSPWSAANNKVDTSVQRGFYTAREMSYSLSMSSRIFGTLLFPKSKNITAIRHEIKPQIGISYKPDLVSEHWKTIVVDSAGNKRQVAEYGNSVLSLYSPGKFGGITFGLDNLLEMKKKNNKDSTGDNPTTKVKLIDGLSINTAYNLLADSLAWSPISMSFRSTLFQKLSITGNATLDPYGVDASGQRFNDLLWKTGSIGRLTNAGLSMSTSLQSKSKDGKTKEERVQQDETLTLDEQMQTLSYMQSNPAEFTDFDIPWTLSFSFSTNFSRLALPNFTYRNVVTSSVSVNGDFSLTPKWKMGGNIYFDVKAMKVGTLTMYITRDMHCWQLAINITPIGYTRSFSIVLNPKSGILRDLRINRSRYFYNN